MQTKKEYNGQVTEGNQIFLRIETTYKFVNVEKPEETIEVITYGDGVDTQDKAALTRLITKSLRVSITNSHS